jgi:hypothetical protein
MRTAQVGAGTDHFTIQSHSCRVFKTSGGCRVAQEHLSSKHEALISNPSTARKKKVSGKKSGRSTPPVPGGRLEALDSYVRITQQTVAT